MVLPWHISGADSLVTSRSATRAGFIRIALRKNALANPYVTQGLALRTAAAALQAPTDLVSAMSIRPAVLAASGLSKKALQFMDQEDRDDAIEQFVEEYLNPAGDGWVDELVFRFLLTSGDALGGKTRNLVGRLADKRFLGFVIAALQIREEPISWHHAKHRKWFALTDAEEAAEHGNGLEWQTSGQPRTLLFNVKVPLVQKNVDSVLLRCTAAQAKQKDDPFIRNANFYIALGELKGGYDPAGADEHWKTANHTLSRIGQAFAGAQLNPKRYFVGAAVETAMAQEIVVQLQNSHLANAANLTDDGHMSAFADWLVSL